MMLGESRICCSGEDMLRKIVPVAVCATFLAACSTDPYTGEQKISNTAVGATAGAQLRFLVVHVEADAAARQRTEAGADQHRLAGRGRRGLADDEARRGAEQGAGARADSGVRDLLFARVRIG